MYRIINLFILSCFVLLLTCEVSLADWPWSKTQDLVSINDSSYTADDYKHWWENRQGKGKNVPHDIQSFIEWKLLVQEALSMELDQKPSLKRKTDVFMKVRRRMQIKYETVDSKINISEQDRRERFEAEFNPISFFTFLYFRSEEKANETLQLLKDGTLSFEDLKDLPESEGGPHQSRQGQYYPKQFNQNAELDKTLGKLQMDDRFTVFPSRDFFVLARFDKQEAPDAGLYKRLRGSINSRLVKEKTIKFSSELIRSLRQKYEVQINEDLLAQASGEMEGEILEQPIATTNKENIPIAPLVKDIRKEHSYRKLETWSAEKRAELYRGLLDGMINEYLITWESIERHYEDKPPLKWTLEYHKEKNLISELENLLFEPKVLLQDDEITKYYQEHIDDYKDPDLFTVAMLDAEKDLVEKIWQEVSRGGNIFEVARRHESILSPKEDIQLGELSPDIAAAVQKLDVDEVSPPIQGTKNRLKLVVLMDRSGGGLQTLESVKKAIIKKLRPKKFQQVKEEYVEKLEALSEIKLNQKIWNKLIADQKK